MDRFKTHISFFLLCIILIVLLFAYFVIYNNQDHLCSHQRCQTCLKVGFSEQVIDIFKTLTSYILLIIYFYKIALSKLKTIYNFINISITPVSLKVIILS